MKAQITHAKTGVALSEPFEVEWIPAEETSFGEAEVRLLEDVDWVDAFGEATHYKAGKTVPARTVKLL